MNRGVAMYKCDRCGNEFNDAYSITKYFNGGTSVETVCEDCIRKIGKENGTSDNDSNLRDSNSVSVDR